MENSITVDLKSLPVFWTTCDKSVSRHPSMLKMLEDLGLYGEKINGPITTPYTIGVAQGYIQALKKVDPPFVILEDDATLLVENPNLTLSYPSDTDALYLGTSLYGRIQNRTVFGSVIAANYSDRLLRVFNMLAFHAVLYTSKRYVDYCIKTLENFLAYPIGGCDDPIADNMWRHNIYCLKSPLFYQKDGRSDEVTKTKLQTLL